ncbi:MAG TPA: hypothetical protein VIK48_07070, partial [Candidatus Manganitrophaceae bacterium]
MKDIKIVLPPPRGRSLSRWISAFLFMIPLAALFLLLLLSDQTLVHEIRNRIPFLETTRVSVHQYLDEKGILSRLEGFKIGFFRLIGQEGAGPPKIQVFAPSEEDGPAFPVPETEISNAFHPPSEEMRESKSPVPSGAAEDAQTLFQQAKERYNAGDVEEVEKKLRRIIEIDPNAVLAYHLLGTLFLEKKEFDTALRIFSDASAIFPEDATLHYDLGFLYFKQGIDSLTIQELGAALKLAPQASQSGRARQILGKLDPQFRRGAPPRKREMGGKPDRLSSQPAPPAPAQGPAPTLPASLTPLQRETAPNEPSDEIRSLIMRQKRGFETKDLALYRQDHARPNPILEQKIADMFERFDQISVNYEIYELKIEEKEASASLLQTM